MAIGKESIKRAASVNSMAKEGKVETTEIQQKLTIKAKTKKSIATKSTNVADKAVGTESKEIVSNIKSELPIYLL